MVNPVPNEPKGPAGKPQGTLLDQEQTMEAEGQPVAPTPDEPSQDPTVNADAIFAKLEQQTASENGTQVDSTSDAATKTTSKD